MLPLDPVLPPKPLGTQRLHRVLPHKDMPSRLGSVNASPNFIETEKIKQDEKIEDYVSNERTTTTTKTLKKP